MNALVSIDRILSPETIATPADILTPAIVFAPGGVEAIISKLEAEVRATDRDMTTDQGREAIKSLAYKVARSKTALDEMGKELVADIKKQSGAIDAERRIIRERLDALRDEVRGPLTAWENAETARVDAHEKALAFIVTAASYQGTPTAAQISGIITHVQEANVRDWQEFAERAEAATAETLDRLAALYNTAVQAEADAAELAELRRLKAEREEADRKAAELSAAAEQARLIEEARSAREAEEAARVAEWQRKREEQSERNVQAAVAATLELERQQAAAKKAAEDAATAKREANTRHRNKIHREIAADLCSRGFSELEANNIVSWLANGEIPHVSITY